MLCETSTCSLFPLEYWIQYYTSTRCMLCRTSVVSRPLSSCLPASCNPCQHRLAGNTHIPAPSHRPLFPPLYAVCCLLSAVRCLLSAVSCLLSTVQFIMFVFCFQLFGVVWGLGKLSYSNTPKQVFTVTLYYHNRYSPTP
jgi:hypothetical protein